MTCPTCSGDRLTREGRPGCCEANSCHREHDTGRFVPCPRCCACTECGAVVPCHELHREMCGDYEVRECADCLGERATEPEMRGAA